MRCRLAGLAAMGATLSLAACSSILGLKDLELDPLLEGGPDGVSGGDTGAGDVVQGDDARAGDDSTTLDSTSDAPADVAVDVPIDVPSETAGGTCDGGLTFCTGTCTDVSGDKHNCGVCGHDCEKGACSSSTCQPYVLGSPINAWDIAANATTIYWVDGKNPGNVDSCSVGTTCTPGSIKSGQVDPERITLDGTGNVFWTVYGSGAAADGAVWVYNGSSSSAVVTTRESPKGIAADGNYLYWTEEAQNSLVQYKRIGPTLTSSPGQSGATGIALASGEVYWANSGGGTIASCTEGTCSPSLIVNGQSTPFAVGIDATFLYWTNYSATGSVYQSDHGGGSPNQLGGQWANPARVVSDGTMVYWTNSGTTPSDGSVVGCDPNNCSSPTTIKGTLNQPVGLALTAAALYFGTYGDNKLWKVVR